MKKNQSEEKNRAGNSLEHTQSLDQLEPGFNRIPNADVSTPAATDMIDEAVDRGIDKLRNDFTK
ncbi:hypothetical protein ACFQ5D_06390 [Paenibacillus farraposensis]|uniref:Uncharacterized protein n=1 Tax=Paenibacillus farraposensis TaxID=2807095 RepID=A0ABW4DAQ2_9BACL|nr:hypothetical protein [Paenibacillus farraposensis]MCC3379961.1 hypothetical protein [Paenibacillus farraposensis]